MQSVAELFERLAAKVADDVGGGPGPVKWCRGCGRKHPARESCGLVEVLMPAKSGQMVRRWVRI